LPLEDLHPMIPTLRYGYLHRDDLDPDVVGDHQLARIHEVSARIDNEGALYVVVTGPMLKRDGGAGPTRGCVIDFKAEQPKWLDELIADARGRLATYVDEGWWHPNVNAGKVHEHTDRQPATMHRQCEPVYTRRRMP